MAASGSFASAALCWLVTSTLLAADVTIEKADPADLDLAEKAPPLYTVTATTYTVKVYAPGRVSLSCGNVEVLKNIVFGLAGQEKVTGDIRLEDGPRLVLREGEARKASSEASGPDAEDDALGEPVEQEDMKPPVDLPGYGLKFLADRIEVSLADLRKPPGRKRQDGGRDPPPPFCLYGVFGDRVLAVKNLRSGEEDALPAWRLHSPHPFSFYGQLGHSWPHVEVTCADGLRVEISGISGLGHALGSRRHHVPYPSLRPEECPRGFWALIDAQPDSKPTLTVKPPDTAKDLAPAPYYDVRPDQPRGMFNAGEPVLYHLDFAAEHAEPGRYRVSWVLEDHRQRVLQEGEQPLELGPGATPPFSVDIQPRTMGYYRVRLSTTRADAAGAKRTHEFSCARMRLERPEFRALDQQHGIDSEMVWANVLGLRGLRLTPSLVDIWAASHDEQTGEIDWERHASTRETFIKVRQQGTVRTFVNLMSGSASDRALEEWFKKRYAEPSEAPDLDGDPTSAPAEEDEELPREKEMERKEAEPEKGKKDWRALMEEAKQRWLGQWVRYAKEKEGIDAWEPFNEPNLGMSPEAYLENLLMVQYPIVKQANPQANYLGGSICGLENHGWVRRLYELGGQKYFDGISFHPYTGLGFQEGYRAEMDQWWQVVRDFGDDPKQGLWMTESAWHRGWGFNDYVYDRFNAQRESQARNAVHMLLHAEGMGIPRDRVYVFYMTEHGYNDFYLMRYTEPTAPAIALQVLHECLGDAPFVRELPLPGKGHYFQLYADTTRTVAAAFTSSEPVPLTVTTDADTVAVTDLMGNRETVRTVDGRLQVTLRGEPTYFRVPPGKKLAPAYDEVPVQPNLALAVLGTTASGSNAPDVPNALPITGDWTGMATSRYAWCEPPEGADHWPDWFEVRLPRPVPLARVRTALDYGAWERTLRDYDLQVFAGDQWKTVGEVRANFYQNVIEHHFEPVTTDRLRLLITMVNSCLFEKIDWIPKQSCLRSVEVYGPPAGRAKAFIIHELPRRVTLAPGQTARLSFRMQNATPGPLDASLRLIVPEGMTARPFEQAVSLPPGSETSCTATVHAGLGTAAGIHAVLAGLYHGDELVCPDYATRIIECK